MKSRTSYFNKTLFLKNTTRFWPIWSLYLVIWVLMLPIPMINYYNGGPNVTLRLTEYALEFGVYGGMIMSAIFCFAAAVLVFMFTYSARSTNFVASLPMSRECVFITCYLSGLCWFIVSNVIVFLLTLFAQASSQHVAPMGMVQWFAIVSLFNLIFYSISVICIIIAGNIIGGGLLYAAANGGLIITEILIRLISAEYIKGLTFFEDIMGTFSRYLTPVVQLWGRVDTTYGRVGNGEFTEWVVTSVKYNGWQSLLIYAVVGIILSVIALLLYRRRHMETASDLISVKPLRPVFKYLAAFFCALTLGMLIYIIVFAFGTPSFSQIPLAICMMFGCAIGYFGSEMLLHKSFRVFKSWKGYVACVVVIVLFMTGVSLDVFGIGKRVPNPANVRSAELNISGGYDGTEFSDEEDIKTVTEVHKMLIGDEYTADVGGSADLINDNVYDIGYDTSITITYRMKSGGSMVRRYHTRIAKTSELYRILDSLVNTPEAMLSRVKPGIDVTARTTITGEIYSSMPIGNGEDNYQYVNITLTSEQARYLYENCILPDTLDGKIGRLEVDGSDYYESDTDVNVYLSFENTSIDNAAYASEGDDLHLSISNSAERTMDYIRQLIANGHFDEYGNFIYNEDEYAG